MGKFPNKAVMFACASILSIFSQTDVEARPPFQKGAAPEQTYTKPLKVAPDAIDPESLPLESKQARCGRKRKCDKTRVISRVPVTISKSGKYCVNRDLTYTGSGAAIVVEADNVTINFANHSLFLTDPAAEGILAVDVEEFTLLNDKISLNQISNLASSNAIHLVNVSKARIDNIYTENTLRGIRLEGSNDVNITNTHHTNHVGGNDDGTSITSGSGIDIRTSTGVTVDNSYFEGTSGTNHFQTCSVNISGSRNVNLTNTKHENVDGSFFIALISTGILIDNCVANYSSEAFYAGVSIGASNDESPSRDIIIRNSTFTNLNAFEGWDGFNVGLSEGLVFENLVIDVNTTIAEDYTPGALHFGCGSVNGCEEAPLFASNGLISNVIINNINTYPLLIEAGENLVFDNIEVTGGTSVNAYFLLAIGNTLKNSYIGDSSGGDGIVLAADADTNAILNNTVSGNATGIIVATGAENTRVEENDVFNNSVFGINNSATTSQLYYNRSCGNGPGPATNCSGIPLNITNQPGDPSVVGENICCQVAPQ